SLDLVRFKSEPPGRAESHRFKSGAATLRLWKAPRTAPLMVSNTGGGLFFVSRLRSCALRCQLELQSPSGSYREGRTSPLHLSGDSSALQGLRPPTLPRRSGPTRRRATLP